MVKTPYEVLFKANPSYDHIKLLGCLCFAQDFQRQKDNQGIGNASPLDIIVGGVMLKLETYF